MNNIPTSEHFTIEELCRSQVAVCLGIDNEPKREDIIANLKRLAFHTLEAVRILNGNKPITITSGYRCKELNRAVGGVATSQHQCVCAGRFFCEKRKNVRNSAACGYCFYVVFVYFKSAFFVFIRRKNSYNGFREKFLLKLIRILDIFSAFQYYYPTFYCYLQV